MFSGRILHAKETGLLVVVLLLAGGLAVHSELNPIERDGRRVNTFLQSENLDLLFKETSYLAVMAVGATMVIAAGGIDLSIGSIYCLAAVLGALFLEYFGPAGRGAGASPAWTVPVGIAVCLGAGALCGLANGVILVALRVHPFIVTLGTMAIYRGIAFVITEGQTVRNFPTELTHGLIGRAVGPLYPVPALLMAVVLIAAGVFLKHTVWGRYAYAIGGNELASRYSGVRVERIKVLVFTLAGLTGGVAAVILLGVYGAANSGTGTSYELQVIAAAVVGGASLSGGRGTALGAFLGALIITLIGKAIILLNINQAYSRIIIGVVVICAVVVDRFSVGLVHRRMVRAAGGAGAVLDSA